MVGQSVDQFACRKFPDDHGGVFARTSDESAAQAHTDFGDVVGVALQTGLQHQCLAVPDLQAPTER